MQPPVQIQTQLDPDAFGQDRHLTVNRADRGDANVVVSFNDSTNGHRDAFGIPPDAAIEFAIALLNAAQWVKAGFDCHGIHNFVTGARCTECGLERIDPS